MPGPRDDSTLVGRCTACKQPKSSGLSLIVIHPRQSVEPRFALICGPCLVDGISGRAA